MFLSSFEAELDALTSGMKAVDRVTNILTELRQVFEPIARVYSDNKAMVEFVKGMSVAKNSRHMALRMWFMREKYKSGKMNLGHCSGKIIHADKLTKLGSKVTASSGTALWDLVC